MANSYFKNGVLNRDPRKPSPVIEFKRPAKYKYNQVITKSPMQKQEMKK